MAGFDGGAALKKRLDEIARNLTKAGSVRIGFLEGGRYPDGTSVPMVAAINEFGAPSRGQPPRPFFRGMIADKSGGWPDFVEAALKATNYDTEKTLALLGAEVASQLQQSIIDFEDPPLAPATIARKGFAKPLISSGHMLDSVAFEVE